MAHTVSNGLLEDRKAVHTFEPLLSGLGVTAGLVEVVAGTDRGDGTADLESSGHVDDWRKLMERWFGVIEVSRKVIVWD